MAVEITAAVAQREPDGDLAQARPFGLRHDFDHLDRYSATLDPWKAKDANGMLQYTPTCSPSPDEVERSDPGDDPRR